MSRTDDAQCCGKADAVGIVPAVASGVIHELADGEMAAQMAPDLLQDQVGGLRAQHDPGSTLVGLELVEGVLDLPTLGVGGGQLARGYLLGVGECGEQPVDRRVVPSIASSNIEGVVNDAHEHRFLAAGGGRGEPTQVRQPGAVVQVAQVPRLGAGLVGSDPPQQVRAGCDGVAPQHIGEESAVGQHQHARGERLQESSGELRLGLPIGPDPGGEDGVRAALGQREDPDLRERRLLALVHPGPPEVLGVLGGVGYIQARPVDGDQSPPRQPRTRRLRAGDRAGHRSEQPGHRLGPQPDPGLEIADFDGNR
jgi:hypothetical protein